MFGQGKSGNSIYKFLHEPCQWISLNELFKLMKVFLKFQISFQLFGKPKIIQENRDA